MKCCVSWLLLVIGCVCAAPVEQGSVEPGSCSDAFAVGAAEQALSKINRDRNEGYVLQLHHISNVHTTTHLGTGVVFYLTMDVVETSCHVLSRKDSKDCEARPDDATPVYGQCRAVIFMDRVHRVVRLYKYNCAIRPVPSSKVSSICPDCPSPSSLDDDNAVKTVNTALDKYNKESGLNKWFTLLNVTRAFSQMGIAVFYNAEFTIQETTCDKTKDLAQDDCPAMQCEFAHKGFCKASRHVAASGEEDVTVDCEIYEPEAAVREKKLHLLGGETDHSHSETRPQDLSLSHDHQHNHAYAGHTHTHTGDDAHHHTHDHDHGSSHRHGHDHSHDHGHGHDHVHAHHAKAHDHSGDIPNKHHDYKHTIETHDHDHELALDHEHHHYHLHEHEHHHHHHEHEHENTTHDHPEGIVRTLPAMDQPMTTPAFPDEPTAGPEQGVTLNLRPDPQIPGQMEPHIMAFPKTVSAQCPASEARATLVEKAFAEDAVFKV